MDFNAWLCLDGFTDTASVESTFSVLLLVVGMFGLQKKMTETPFTSPPNSPLKLLRLVCGMIIISKARNNEVDFLIRSTVNVCRTCAEGSTSREVGILSKTRNFSDFRDVSNDAHVIDIANLSRPLCLAVKKVKKMVHTPRTPSFPLPSFDSDTIDLISLLYDNCAVVDPSSHSS